MGQVPENASIRIPYQKFAGKVCSTHRLVQVTASSGRHGGVKNYSLCSNLLAQARHGRRAALGAAALAPGPARALPRHRRRAARRSHGRRAGCAARINSLEPHTPTPEHLATPQQPRTCPCFRRVARRQAHFWERAFHACAWHTALPLVRP